MFNKKHFLYLHPQKQNDATGYRGRVARQRSAKPSTAVRIRPVPQKLSNRRVFLFPTIFELILYF